MTSPQRRLFTILLATLVLQTASGPLTAWCALAHEHVNAAAVERLPNDHLHDFYHLQLAAVVALSNDPDNWSENHLTDFGQPYEHFINLDRLSSPPFTDIPTNFDDALAKYGRKELEAAGTVPWTIRRQFDLLTDAFRKADWNDVVRRSAWLGHYVADCTNPLHVTRNYMGQETGNVILPTRGPDHSVHQRFEWGMIERYPDHILNLADPAHSTHFLPDSSSSFVWDLVRQTYPYARTVLEADLKAARSDPSFSDTYYAEMFQATGDIAHDRLDHATDTLASLWLTAWIRAGSPPLPQTVIVLPHTVKRPPGPSYSNRFAVPLTLCLATGATLLLFLLRRRRAA